VIYLDSSALLKLVREEAETPALVTWLQDHPDQPLVTSELGRVEVLRAARRAGDLALVEAQAVLADLDLVPLDRSVQDVATGLDPVGLRTLDALHVASAALLAPELTALVAYDSRLLQAATAAGLAVVAPGTAPA
jgi:predicted nucleic acid-binding protein